MPSHFEEDTYNVKKILSTVLTARDVSSRCGGRVIPKIGIPRNPLKRSYRPTTKFGEIGCRNRVSPKPLTSLPTLVDRSHERATQRKP